MAAVAGATEESQEKRIDSRIPRELARLMTPDVDKPKDNTVYKCQYCDLTVNSQHQLTQHETGSKHIAKVKEALEGAPVLVKCDVCNVVFNSDHQAQQHYDSPKHLNRVAPGSAYMTAGASVAGSSVIEVRTMQDAQAAPPIKTVIGQNSFFGYAGRFVKSTAEVVNSETINMDTSTSNSVSTINAEGTGTPAANSIENAEVKVDGTNKFVRCTVCEISFNSDVQAQQHLGGTKHKKKCEAAGVRMGLVDPTCIGTELGYNIMVGSSMMTLRLQGQGYCGKQETAVSGSGPLPGRCDFCGVCFNSTVQAQQHFASPRHLARISGGTPGTSTTGDAYTYVSPGSAPGYSCQSCGIFSNSASQFQAHIKGNKHKIKVGQIRPQAKKPYDPTARNYGSKREAQQQQQQQQQQLPQYSTYSAPYSSWVTTKKQPDYAIQSTAGYQQYSY